MEQRLFYILFILTVLAITGCSNSAETIEVSSNSIDVEEVLTLDPDADVFQFDGTIYKTTIDWVKESSLTKDAQIGVIKTRNNTNTEFEDGMSNKLPVGTKIFSAKERGDILLVEVNGEVIEYFSIDEG